MAVTGRKLSPHDTTRWTRCKGYGALEYQCDEDPLPGHFLCKWCEEVRQVAVEEMPPFLLEPRYSLRTDREWWNLIRAHDREIASRENALRAMLEPHELELLNLQQEPLNAYLLHFDRSAFTAF